MGVSDRRDVSSAVTSEKGPAWGAFFAVGRKRARERQKRRAAIGAGPALFVDDSALGTPARSAPASTKTGRAREFAAPRRFLVSAAASAGAFLCQQKISDNRNSC
jgi:hypothetical protein